MFKIEQRDHFNSAFRRIVDAALSGKQRADGRLSMSVLEFKPFYHLGFHFPDHATGGGLFFSLEEMAALDAFTCAMSAAWAGFEVLRLHDYELSVRTVIDHEVAERRFIEPLHMCYVDSIPMVWAVPVRLVDVVDWRELLFSECARFDKIMADHVVGG